ncbi:MAG: hypothetical protein AAFR14_03985 [Bacteroidota bacterium]
MNRYCFSTILSALFALSTWTACYAEEGLVTDIILINGKAELVEFSKEGDIVTRHMAVPDYFTSGKSHTRSLRQSLEKLNVYGDATEESSTQKVTYLASVECRQSLMSVAPEVEGDINSDFLDHVIIATASKDGSIMGPSYSPSPMAYISTRQRPVVVRRSNPVVELMAQHGV